MNQIKTEIHNLTVVFPAQRWLPESRMTTTFVPMGSDLYRLDEGFLWGPISFGDVIEALPTDKKGVVIFCRRVKRAGLRRNCYIIPHNLAEKPRFAELMKRIEDLGGFAAVDFKGLFLVFLPKACNLDVAHELDGIGISTWKRRVLDIQAGLKRRLQQRWKKTMTWLANLR
jgi:hypothetical protein